MCARIMLSLHGWWVISVKRPNWNVTGGRFRSYVLWGVIHNRPQVRLRVVVKVEDGVNSALPLRHTGECWLLCFGVDVA